MELKFFPTLNALLNSASSLLALAGYTFIRQKKVSAHKACMLGAFFSSVAFFISYSIYHANAGATKFMGTGWIRPVYFAILLSHTVLAALIVPMVLVTLFWALKGEFSRHRAIAKWAFPLWLYVSITGVLIYLMLYHLFPAR